MNSSTGNDSNQNKKIFLSGLSYQSDNETLQLYCSQFGQIADCVIIRDAEGKSRGFGFVTYQDMSSVDEFMHCRPHTIDNRQIEARRAMPRDIRNNSEAHLSVKRLFVGGLTEDINEGYLQEYFSRYGNITQVVCIKDRFGKSRGIAFVSFDDYDAVDKAILEKPHVINGHRVNVEKAEPREKSQEGTNFSGEKRGLSSNKNNFGYGNDNRWNDQQGYTNSSGFSSPYDSMRNDNDYRDIPFDNNRNQQQNYNRNDFVGMNNSDSYGITSSNTEVNYNDMSQQQSRSGGPIRGGYGNDGPFGNNQMSKYDNRSAPYPMRGNSSNYRGRGRGEFNRR